MQSIPSLTAKLLREYAIAKPTNFELAKQIESKIFNLNIKLVWEIAHLYKSKQPQQEIDDLFQVASIGMLKGISSFDFERGGKFPSHVGINMHHELCRYLHNDSPIKISRSLSDDYLKGRKLIGKLSDTAIAQKFGWSLEYWQECQDAYAARNTFSLHCHVTENPQHSSDVIHEWVEVEEILIGDNFIYGEEYEISIGRFPNESQAILHKIFIDWATQKELAPLLKAHGIKWKSLSSWVRSQLSVLL